MVAKTLSQRSKRALTAERLIAALDGTSLIQEYDDQLEGQRIYRERLSRRQGNDRPFAVVFHWDRLPIQRSIVVHSNLPSCINIPGSHLALARKRGSPLMLETLSVFMDGLDNTRDPSDWLLSAVTE